MKFCDVKPEWLVYLGQVAAAGGIRQAARELYISEHSLRYNLKALERYMQAPMFVEGPKGMLLSPEGLHVLESGRSFLTRLNSVQERLQGLIDTRFELRLALARTYPLQRVTPLLLLLQRRFVDLHLQVQLTDPRDVEKRVSQGDCEIGLATWSPENQQLHARKGPVWPGLYVRRAAEVPERYLLPQAWNSFRDTAWPESVFALDVRFVGAFETIRSMSLAGAGIGYLPLSHVEAELASGQLIEAKGPELGLRISEHVLVRDPERLSPPADCLLELLQANWHRGGASLPCPRAGTCCVAVPSCHLPA